MRPMDKFFCISSNFCFIDVNLEVDRLFWSLPKHTDYDLFVKIALIKPTN